MHDQPSLKVKLNSGVADRVQAGVIRFAEVNAAEENPFAGELDTLAATLRRAHGGKAPSEIPGLEPARRLYRAFGVDPTRTRPSSEALLRRVLKGQSLFRINRLVDAGNWASLSMLLPLGLYDLECVRGDLVIRVGAEGESYPGIRKDDVNVGGRLTIADDEGPFGSPTSDSARTRIRPGTRSALAVIFAPADFPELALNEGMGRMAETVRRWCEAEVAATWALRGGV